MKITQYFVVVAVNIVFFYFDVVGIVIFIYIRFVVALVVIDVVFT
jgi:hypothetical protein